MNNLTELEIRALNEALDDEYHSWATYDQVIADFGQVQPFGNIREAEARHIEALRTLFVRYELPMPKNSWPGKVARYASLQAACEAAVAAEIANGAMYDRLLNATQRPDIIKVLNNLQKASKERHLPAFQRCVQHSGEDGGKGHGKRRQ
ncbi:MAG: DUF2202 domain-containing protein [Nitrosomonas sp.]|uniref:ferritin-like domain-containing protein n=1 Tax=Nitrosomonas sp. TaxID=42353 RepID=UPI0027191FFF|nr:DUF2202 domain-containing protein [Nitrosomonas sp.]MDO8893866.1 DUF2202 domain-containing protein [Nitrosomonas sp.]MDP3662183.1 DUF2202 domain-containing protein [Nitrosomonas sp.]MDZ4105124.1 DUF2202 domain-containing protein [Nitrosomonas sp.]